ncbi:ubiquinol-cytochrome-c reductase complex assembly factor 1-like [Uloborus diversus]|uniref:ubiquinol-cytochrome-c reductase complex assembly factor 1-like n=1 Tax=Uloborus diversus TaxID=327109 RepID=UPI00240A682B|nr:ubiquinol-cytochrome-c reductase complex assembly factor 1-like [Uloborus diversus]XP_054708511.1 ubiquinol-cytochrome-c reductase complex assembly factor 1-like [Uloborus diversus]XP_054708512.1 ubiquinol-cytochrome-c reductase complex assembly factor 1-like [Uloborus diversus]XP_054708513.1 ubiquinol-cytochrome-c reductase complex assembly factor 1-like [Uloborus diversus]
MLSGSRFLSSYFIQRVSQVRGLLHYKCQYYAGNGILYPKLCESDFRSMNQIAMNHSSAVAYAKTSVFGRLKRKIYDSYSSKTKINVSAQLVYESCVDGIDWNEFIEYFGLPDTLHSWFLLVQLHVWMCVLVLVSETQGRIFRNVLIDAMWNDVEARLDKLAVIKSSKKKEYLAELLSQFQAALISYDEGILGDDTCLAAAVWRTMFNFRDVDPRTVEDMVYYIRRQLSHLDSLNTENMLFYGKIKFLPLKDIIEEANKEKELL